MDVKFAAGDVVRLIDDGKWTKEFSMKTKDRYAIVEWVGPNAFGAWEQHMKVQFQKRNGRGKVFSEIMRKKYFQKKEED